MDGVAEPVNRRRDVLEIRRVHRKVERADVEELGLRASLRRSLECDPQRREARRLRGEASADADDADDAVHVRAAAAASTAARSTGKSHDPS